MIAKRRWGPAGTSAQRRSRESRGPGFKCLLKTGLPVNRVALLRGTATKTSSPVRCPDRVQPDAALNQIQQWIRNFLAFTA